MNILKLLITDVGTPMLFFAGKGTTPSLVPCHIAIGLDPATSPILRPQNLTRVWIYPISLNYLTGFHSEDLWKSRLTPSWPSTVRETVSICPVLNCITQSVSKYDIRCTLDLGLIWSLKLKDQCNLAQTRCKFLLTITRAITPFVEKVALMFTSRNVNVLKRIIAEKCPVYQLLSRRYQTLTNLH